MNELDAFLESTLPRLKAAETALHNGDARQRIEMWSRNDPLTLFGAARNAAGWAEVGPVFDMLASRFSDCTSVAGSPPTPYSLRVTTIFRREEGEWKVVHRHGDPFDASAGQLVSRFQELGTP